MIKLVYAIRRRADFTAEGRDAQRRLLEDEREFIDFPGSLLFLTEEHSIFDLDPERAR